MDELLPYYNRELAAIRHLGVEFAKAHPKIAGRLRWIGDSTEDPHVSRLIEGFAYLNARTRQKIDDDFPELSSALMGLLYPHYLAPIPSSAMIQCRLSANEAELLQGYRIPRGTIVETEFIDGQPCRFRTVYDTTLWPVEITQVSYASQPFVAPPTPVNRESAAVLKIELKTFAPKSHFSRLTAREFRFFLHGDELSGWDLFELIHNHCRGVAWRSGDASDFQTDAVSMVGFDRDQGLVDYSPRSFPGYRWLTEFFAFAEKFSFFEVPGLSEAMRSKANSDRLEIFLFFDRHIPDVERWVSRDTLRLGCTPIVNLYRQRAEPIRWQQTQYEYRVVPDARRPLAHEVYSIDRVVGTSPRDESVEFTPFYSVKHGGQRLDGAYWYARREQAEMSGGQIDHGTELYLSLVDLDFKASELSNWTIDVELSCVNRDLPRRLPFGAGQPALRLTGKAALARVECLTAPTPTYRPHLSNQNLWKLISHLSLGHLSLVDGVQGAEALREILRVYEPTGAPENLKMISGLRSVASRRIVGRVAGGAASGFCRGVEVTLEFDDDVYAGSSILLFSAVLERFLALYSSMNSFTKTVATTSRRSVPLRIWPPRVGEQLLL